ncbi:TIR domain-containing protein [Sphaerotilaceae bacterium SBD11-9]
MLKLVSPPADAAPPVPGEPRYWAFLSYSHHDKAIAKKLQKQLETYRVPRRLVGRETSHGPVPARVSPVFRDRDELHAGADLKASVQDALSKSRWLIVVCTPDAARSPWVNREIVEFKKLRGERHVLALIARGEPFASDMPGREAEECFPPALRRALNEQGLPEGEPLEPIAADMRKEGDGPQRAMLKLLAGMVGVSFDDLVRRDMQRRVRLLSVVAGASVLGLVAFAFLAVMAVQSRNEAQHQRVQAEGLIEFMLGDLRKKLEPVGRLEVLDSVGEKALAYYSSQESGKLDATALGHRSRAMHLIGEIRDLRGNPAEAQKAFEQAAETTAWLLAQSPNDGQRVFDHAQSVFWVGYAAWKRADGKTAEEYFREYLRLAQRLIQIDGTNVDWQAEVAFAQVNLGTVQLGTGRPTDALGSLQVAGELLSELVPQRPGLRLDLANNYGWRADAYELLGDYEHALQEQRHKLAVFRAMPQASENRVAQYGIFGAIHSISLYELALGKVANAEADARQALEMADALVSEDPKNLRWRGHSCSLQLRLVEIELIVGRRADAQRSLAKASQCVAVYNAAGTTGLRDSTLLEARSLYLAAQLSGAGESEAMARRLSSFLDRTVPTLKSDTPDRLKLATELANVALALAEMRSDASLAQDDCRRAEALLRPFSDLRDGGVLTSLARARLKQGDISEAQVILSRIQRTSYRHPGYADLVKNLQAARGGSRPT